ncbi:hypothetical protein SDC9_136526 [bioreactor metagenome]|uniref:Uncharacterized protein n=1 Tax=bioreactor metagenome TaxID=1076179 RepID=A0A645DJH0_9ZZZZ
MASGDVHHHALALITVLRLHHYGQAHFFGHDPGVLDVLDGAAQRHRHTGCVQQALGEVFVLRDGFGHGAGHVQFGGLDAARLGAPAELHQRARSQAAERNAACDGGIHDGAGGGADAFVFIGLAQISDGLVGVERRVLERGLQ